jgi:hypothetical protein
MIISLVMPVTPQRSRLPHLWLARRLRRQCGQTNPEQRNHAAQDDDEDERHRWTRIMRPTAFGLRPSALVGAEDRSPKAEGLS